MPIKDYSTTAANNTLTPPNGAPEGMAAGLVNNTIRQVMADTRSWYESGGWCDLGHVPTFVSTTSFTIPTDVTAFYTAGRRIRMYGPIMGTFYGFITASTYLAPNTTVTVVLDSGALTSNLSRVDLAFTDQEALRLADNSVTTSKIADNAVTTAKIADNAVTFSKLSAGARLAGGYINFFRNPFMEVAQRGTSGSVTAGSSAYTIDGWVVVPTGANVSWQQGGSITSGTVYASNSLGLLGAASLSACTVTQRIESGISAQFAGKRVTIQFSIQNQTGTDLTPSIGTYYPNATDDYTAATTDLASTNLQTIASGATATVAYTFDVNSLATRGYGVDLRFGNQLNGSGKNVFISAADIRYTPDTPVGLNSAPPRPEYRPRGPETIFCQRYFWRLIAFEYLTYTLGGSGFRISVPFPVSMRTLPTITTSNTTYLNASAVEAQPTNLFNFRYGATATTTNPCRVTSDITFSSEL